MKNVNHLTSSLSRKTGAKSLCLTILSLALLLLASTSVTAQTWSSSHDGTNDEYWVINTDNSNHWSSLRLQVSSNQAWNMSHANGNSLYWSYDATGTETSLGTTKMILHKLGNLELLGSIRVKNGGLGDQLQFSHNGTKNYTHVIKSRHHGSNAAANALDFYLWNQGTDHIGASGTRHVLTLSGGGSGRVGIRTTSPTEALDVSGNVKATNFIGDGSQLTNVPSSVWTGTSNISYSGGDVGIGTSTPATTLEVTGANSIGFDIANRNNAPFKIGNGSYALYMDANEIHTFMEDGSTDQRDLHIQSGNVNANTILNYNNTGKVGIGTLSPTEKLDVSGNVKATTFIGDGAQLTNVAASSLPGDYSWTTTGNIQANNMYLVGQTGELIIEGQNPSAGWNSRLVLKKDNRAKAAGLQIENRNTSGGSALNWYFGVPYNNGNIVNYLQIGYGNDPYVVSDGIITINPNGDITANAFVGDGSQLTNLAHTQISGLGTAATLNVGTSANQLVQLNGSGALPAVDGSQLTGVTTSLPSNYVFTTTADVTANAFIGDGSQLTNLAHTQISGLGTAATLNAGTSANQLVQLDGSGALPVVDGSQLTGVTASALPADYNFTTSGSVAADSVNASHVFINNGDFAITFDDAAVPDARHDLLRISTAEARVFVGDSAHIMYEKAVAGQSAFHPDSVPVQDFAYSLWVSKGIVTTDLEVRDLDEWADYVFDAGYELSSLDEVETYIRKHGHLPNIPSAEEVKAHGYRLNEIAVKYLEKIEELTLHLIAQEKKNKAFEERLRRLETLLTADEQEDHQ